MVCAAATQECSRQPRECGRTIATSVRLRRRNNDPSIARRQGTRGRSFFKAVDRNQCDEVQRKYEFISEEASQIRSDFVFPNFVRPEVAEPDGKIPRNVGGRSEAIR